MLGNWRQLWEIASAPDNVPIVALLFLVPFYVWYAFRQARATPGLGNEGPFGSLLGMTPYNDVRFALLGGSIVDANALLRAYIWHCIAIPLIASVFMGVHFWRVRKDGGISGPAPVMLETEIKEEKGPRPVIMRPSGMA